jgi:hypothetical protein
MAKKKPGSEKAVTKAKAAEAPPAGESGSAKAAPGARRGPRAGSKLGKGKGRDAAKVAKPVSKPKLKPRPAAPAGGARLQFICSECYEEFSLAAANMKDSLTCPECLHVGKKPAEDFIQKARAIRAREKKYLTLATVFALVAGLFAIAGVMLLSPHADKVRNLLGGDDPSMANMVVGGGFGLFAILVLVFSVQYEKNRWEVYF